MKLSLLPYLGSFLMATAVQVQAVEVLHWDRLPLAVPLVVGQERIVFVDHNVRVGVPASVGDRLRVQSAGGAVYLRANEAIAPVRLQLQDAETGSLILLDIAAEPAQEGAASLEPVRIVSDSLPASRNPRISTSDESAETPESQRRHGNTPIPVILTRYAAQSLYAPLRTVDAVPGLTRVNLRHNLPLSTLLPTLAVTATAMASWRLDNFWVTALRLSNRSAVPINLDPRVLQGDFLTATFQHDHLGPHGTPEDTTVVYLVTRDHGLAESLLPAIQRFDPSINLPGAETPVPGDHHAQ